MTEDEALNEKLNQQHLQLVKQARESLAVLGQEGYARALCKQFYEALAIVGMGPMVIGCKLVDKDGNAGSYGLVHGNAQEVINVLSNMIIQLRMEDFRALLMLMQHGEMFAMHREEATPTPKGKVN